MAIDFPGFRWDHARAEAIARTLQPALEAAEGLGLPLPDRLAALALAAAALVSRSPLARDPDLAARAVATLLVDALRTRTLPW